MEQIPKDTENVSNKEKILHVAIELFSQKGYVGVSLREIAGAVGIKAASIYNHYENKEAILDEIVALFRQQLQKQVYPVLETEENLDISEFIEQVEKANEAFFSTPLYAKIGGIILREQFHNEKVRNLLLEELIVHPRRAITAYFERLIKAGKMRAVDPAIAAKEYHAFYIYEFYESSLSQKQNPNISRIQRERNEHVRLFIQTFCL